MEERSPKLSVKVRNLYNGEHGKLRAVLSVTIGGAYAIHGLKLYETEKGGLFLSMPSQSYEADGETKYTQIFHPITARTGISREGGASGLPHGLGEPEAGRTAGDGAAAVRAG